MVLANADVALDLSLPFYGLVQLEYLPFLNGPDSCL